MIVHSEECKRQWRGHVWEPGPTSGAWHFSCTDGCEARHESRAIVVTGHADATVTKAADILDRAFGSPADQK